MVLKTLGGCEAGEAKTTLGMPFNLNSNLLTTPLYHVNPLCSRIPEILKTHHQYVLEKNGY